MEVKWTSEQQKVIDYRDRDILVSAAAGSGKTAVLVERIVNRISVDEPPVDIDRMLVVTFTKAAAAEMRERVSAAIEAKKEADPDNENLQRQATLVHNALITTIDSFCLFVVQNHFSQIDLDPDFRIGDSAELTLMLKDVMNEVFEGNYKRQDNDAFLALVDIYHKGRNDAAIREMVEEVYRKSSSSSWPKKWIEGLTKLYEADSLGEFEKSPVISEITDYCKVILKEAQQELFEAKELAANTPGLEKYIETLSADIELFDGIDEQESYSSLQQFVSSIKFGRIATIRKFDGDERIKDRVKNMRDAAKATVGKIQKTYFAMPLELMYEQLKRQQPFVNEIVRLSLEFYDAFEAKKTARRVFDFSDIEHFALRILVDEDTLMPTDTAEEFAKHFEEIMIDEYQDSNQVQEDILRSISRERMGENNMFMVGDVKQSIYSFRMARPELFMEKYNTYTLSDSEHQRIDLHKNFRSRAQVLDFANDIFYKIMAMDLGNVAYDKDAALYEGAAYEETADESGADMMSPELMLIDFKDEQLESIIDDEEGDKVQVEALMIANRIKELMENSLVTDKKTGKLRSPQYRDIVILSRSVSTWGNTVSEVLKDCGIPAYVESNTGYFSSYEIQVILSMLRILDNPLQDIPMTAVLSSPIVGLDDEELAEIRTTFSDVSFSQAVLCAMAGESDYENEKLEHFSSIYESLRAAVPDTSIHELLYMILEQTGFYKYAAAMPAGNRRRQNIDMLIEMAVAYEKTSYKGLFHFVRYIDVQQKYEIDYGEADTSGENDDVVRIMTIHKSKGLEFPIVFVSALGRKFNMPESKNDMVIHSDMGIGIVEKTDNPRTKRPSLIRSEIESRIKREKLGEELRVLYVALTRAKEKIILTGGLPDAQKSFEKYHGNVIDGQPISFGQREGAGCYLDWVIPAMLSYPDKYTVTTINADEFAVRGAAELAEKDIARGKLLEMIRSADTAVVDGIAKGFVYEYPYAGDISRKSKYSVSELKHDSMVEKYDSTEKEAEIPEFLLEEKEVYVPSFAMDMNMQISADRVDAGSMLDDSTVTGKVYVDSASDDSAVAGKEHVDSAVAGITAVIGNNRQYENTAGKAGGINPGALRGTAVHRVMECLDFKRICDIDISDGSSVKKFVSESLSDMLQRGLITEDMHRLVKPAIIENFVTSEVALRMAKADLRGDLFREKPFVMDYEGVLVQGIIDVFWLEDDHIIVLDYKTDRVNEAQELVDRYKTQLDLYANALGRIFSDESKKITADEKLIYSFRLQEVIRI